MADIGDAKLWNISFDDTTGTPSIAGSASKILLAKKVGANTMTLTDSAGATKDIMDASDISTQSEIDNGSGAGFISPTTLGGASILRTKYGGFGVAKYDFAIQGGGSGAFPATIPLIRMDATTQGDTFELPNNAWVKWSMIWVDTQLTAGGATTVDIGHNGSTAAIRSGAVASYAVGGLDGNPPTQQFSAFDPKTTSADSLNLMTSASYLTDGLMYVFVEWINF